MKKNLVSISAMEDKGFKATFIDGKVCVWQRNLKDARNLKRAVRETMVAYNTNQPHTVLLLFTIVTIYRK